MPHYGDANSIKWFEIEPCCVFHIINCFEDNDEVLLHFFRTLFIFQIYVIMKLVLKLLNFISFIVCVKGGGEGM